MFLHYIGRFVTLMHAYEPREHMFVPSSTERAPALYHLNYDDPNKLAKHMVGYTDQKGNKKTTYVLEIWKILEVFNEKKLSCNLHYRPSSFRPTKLAGGKYFYPFCCNAHPFWIVFSTLQQLLLLFIYGLMYWGSVYMGIIISYYNFRRRGSWIKAILLSQSSELGTIFSSKLKRESRKLYTTHVIFGKRSGFGFFVVVS